MLLRRPLRRRAIVTPVSERFETDMRAGYPEDAQGVTLGNSIRDGDVLAGVRVRLPLPTVNRPRRTPWRLRLPHRADASARCSARCTPPGVRRPGAAANTGSVADVLVTSEGTFTHEVCEYSTTMCSNNAAVTF